MPVGGTVLKADTDRRRGLRNGWLSGHVMLVGRQ
jgi:hypothetical protein